jgi:sodium/hydrogen antiporter
MSDFILILLVIGGVVLFLGVFSNLFKHWGLPDPLIVLLVGVVLGRQGIDLLDPQEWGDEMVILTEVARLALAIALMGIALRIPKDYLPKAWRSVTIVLLGAMFFMWLSSSFLIGLIMGFSLWTALLVGAIVTPTDPIVASSIVTGEVAEKYLPDSLRNLLSSESGLNDGLALSFVMLPILILSRSPGEALSHWITHSVLWELGVAIIAGAIIGYAAGRILEWAERRNLIEEPSILAFTTALAIFSLAFVQLVEAEGLLSVFVAGLAFDQAVDAGERITEERVVEGIDRFFMLPSFGLLGLMIPWQEWVALGWRAPLIVIALLLLRRLPIFLLFTRRLQELPRTADSLFLGWFGPIGVTALFYAGMAHHHTAMEEAWILTSLLVCASVVVHGITSTPFTRLYGKHVPQSGREKSRSS